MFLKLVILAVALLGVIGISALRSIKAGEPSSEEPAKDPAPGDGSASDDSVPLSDAEWRRFLGSRYDVMRKKGTERAFTGAYVDNKQKGVYRCAGCGQALFNSESKYKSGTGWPSFYNTHSDHAVEMVRDESHGMVRTEVRCSRCKGHLGHVFDDGPRPTGLRFCMNSASLSFQPESDPAEPDGRADVASVNEQQVMFAAGCFWGIEHAFRKIQGVVDASVGYSGGWKENPTYQEVCTDLTGHAEVVRVRYDPQVVAFETLLRLFWKIHDATQVDRQGPDIGKQYRSAIFYNTDEQKATAIRVRDELSISDKFARPIATEITKAGVFWRGEEYHQRYYEKKGLQGCGIK